MHQEAPRQTFSNSEASSTFIALRFWARVTGYEPTDEEKKVLTACEDRSMQLWRSGLMLGGGGGLALASAARLPLPQRVACTGAFASAASFIGQHRANAPCLDDLFELGRHTPSPLVQQAREIIREGSQASTLRMHRQLAASQQQQAPHAETAVAPHATAVSGPTPEPPDHPRDETVDRPRSNTGSDSWEAVRQRYQIRQVEQGPEGTAVPFNAVAPETVPKPRGIVKRNAYGDEVVE